MTHHLLRQIEELKKLTLALGAQVEQNVHQAITAVLERDTDLARQVIDADTQVDLAEIEIEEECLHALALHQPVAQDLRFIVAVLKINNDLERMGDLAVNIAEQARFLAEEGEVEAMPFDLRAMSERVELMLRKMLDALVNSDVQQAQAVRDLDDEVDAMHRGTYEQVQKVIRKSTDDLEQMIHFQNVSRQLERIADHATNVAKDVLYMVEGRIVRHRRARQQQAEQATAGSASG